MPAKVVILAQFGHGYYIRGTLKRLMGVLAWLKAWWICVSVKQVTDQKSMPLLPRWRGNATKVMILAQFDHGYYIHGTLKRLTDGVAWLKAWWIFFGHGYYIRGTLKRLMGVLAWLKTWWIRTGNPCPRFPAGEEMPTKVMILAHFDHRYYIRGTLKRLMGVLAWLKAGWIRFDHGYYIRGTLKRLTDVVAWLKALWIRTRNPCHSYLAGEEMPAKVMILAQFGHGYYIRGTLKRLTDVVAWLKAW
ncbi:hypothetical protein C8R44DRAFT_741987 [Mycena epipterygia]|nr:hypothetical protein C8R44DRAFT_741987 [Mycena epipterygia]